MNRLPHIAVFFAAVLLVAAGGGPLWIWGVIGAALVLIFCANYFLKGDAEQKSVPKRNEKDDNALQEEEYLACMYLGCEEKATSHLSWFEDRSFTKEQHLCEEHVGDALDSFSKSSLRFSGTRKTMEGARQFEIGMVFISEVQDSQAVFLHEVDGSCLFTITVGIFEATSVDRYLRGFQAPRPLTHDVISSSIRLLGGEVQDLVIARLEDQIFYANVRIRYNGKLLLLDLRPSDAFSLAALCECPIFIADQVLSQLDEQGRIK